MTGDVVVADAYAGAVTAAVDALADLDAELERRGAYGASVPAGAYAGIRSVQVGTQWLPTVHAMIQGGEFDALRARLVSRAYLHRLVDLLAGFADSTTGRNCMPGHRALGEQMARASRRALTPDKHGRTDAQTAAYNKARHVYNAIRVVLEAAGVVVCVEAGHVLTGLERLQEHANGSTRRYARAVYALTLPRDATVITAPAPPAHRRHRNGARPVDNRPRSAPPASPVFHPPSSAREEDISSNFVSGSGFSSCEEMKSESTGHCARPAPTKPRHPAANNQKDDAARRPAPTKRRNWEPDPALYQCALDLRRALPGQLGHERPLKVCATIKRFHELGWDTDSLVADLHAVYARLGRHFPTYRPNQPARWLGWALKHLDHTTPPPVRRYDTHAHAADTEPCPHGLPGGARITITHATPRCPQCRHATG